MVIYLNIVSLSLILKVILDIVGWSVDVEALPPSLFSNHVDNVVMECGGGKNRFCGHLDLVAVVILAADRGRGLISLLNLVTLFQKISYCCWETVKLTSYL